MSCAAANTQGLLPQTALTGCSLLRKRNMFSEAATVTFMHNAYESLFLKGRDMAQAGSRRSLTTKARVLSWDRPCEIWRAKWYSQRFGL